MPLDSTPKKRVSLSDQKLAAKAVTSKAVEATSDKSPSASRVSLSDQRLIAKDITDTIVDTGSTPSPPSPESLKNNSSMIPFIDMTRGFEILDSVFIPKKEAGKVVAAAPLEDDGLGYFFTYHGTKSKWASEEGFPVGRPRLDKIASSTRGLSELGWGINFGSEKVARGFQRDGALYRVEIPNSAKQSMLDWRKPVGNAVLDKVQSGIQSSSSLTAMEKQRARNAIYSVGPSPTGERIYDALRESVFVDRHKGQGQTIRQKTSEFLSDIGIVGSRSDVTVGGVTDNNYVVWDQKVLDRVKVTPVND